MFFNILFYFLIIIFVGIELSLFSLSNTIFNFFSNGHNLVATSFVFLSSERVLLVLLFQALSIILGSIIFFKFFGVKYKNIIGSLLLLVSILSLFSVFLVLVFSNVGF